MPILEYIGDFFDMLSSAALMFLCILVGKGWTISTTYIKQKCLLMWSIPILIGITFSTFLWSEFLLNPIRATFFYHEVPGLILLIIRFIMFIWFCWCIRETHVLEINTAKRKFYVWYGILYGFWFISLIITVVVLYFVDLHIRFKVVTVSVYLCEFAGFIVLFFLFWPAGVKKYFSMHAETTGKFIKDENL